MANPSYLASLSDGNLEILDGEGLIATARRLSNSPRRGDCLR